MGLGTVPRANRGADAFSWLYGRIRPLTLGAGAVTELKPASYARLA